MMGYIGVTHAHTHALAPTRGDAECLQVCAVQLQLQVSYSVVWGIVDVLVTRSIHSGVCVLLAWAGAVKQEVLRDGYYDRERYS